jgi:hypothetical protein
MLLEASILLALLGAEPAPTGTPEAEATAAVEPGIGDRPGTVGRPTPQPDRRVETADGVFVGKGAKLDGNDVLQEMLDELAADLARIGTVRVSPILIGRIRVSDNVAPEFVESLEARLMTALQRAAAMSILKCLECSATQGRFEGNEFVMRRGFASRDDLTRLARQYGAQTVLSGMFTLLESPSSLSLDVQVVNAQDATVTFAEGYRVNPQTAILSRSADRAQARAERLKDLMDRIDERPRFTNALSLGALVVPSEMPAGPIWSMYVNYRFTELFGEDREWKIGGILGAAVSPEKLMALLPQGVVQRRVTEKNVFSPTCHVGGAAGMFLTGLEGNSPVISALADCVFGHRIAAQASLNFIVPTKLGGEGGYVAGGLSPQLGMAWSW